MDSLVDYLGKINSLIVKCLIILNLLPNIFSGFLIKRKEHIISLIFVLKLISILIILFIAISLLDAEPKCDSSNIAKDTFN